MKPPTPWGEPASPALGDLAPCAQPSDRRNIDQPDQRARAEGGSRARARARSTASARLQSGERTGELAKSRVTEVEGFLETLELIAKGGSVVDPALVRELVDSRHQHDPLAELAAREREVLGLMAEGRSNAGVGRRPSRLTACGSAMSGAPRSTFSVCSNRR